MLTIALFGGMQTILRPTTPNSDCISSVSTFLQRLVLFYYTCKVVRASSFPRGVVADDIPPCPFKLLHVLSTFHTALQQGTANQRPAKIASLNSAMFSGRSRGAPAAALLVRQTSQQYSSSSTPPSYSASSAAHCLIIRQTHVRGRSQCPDRSTEHVLET